MDANKMLTAIREADWFAVVEQLDTDRRMVLEMSGRRLCCAQVGLTHISVADDDEGIQADIHLHTDLDESTQCLDRKIHKTQTMRAIGLLMGQNPGFFWVDGLLVAAPEAQVMGPNQLAEMLGMVVGAGLNVPDDLSGMDGS